MNPSKQIWVLAGGNGAGKSTFYSQFLKPRGVKLVNAGSDRPDHFPGKSGIRRL